VLFDALVKNCGYPLHKEIGTKDMVNLLKKMAGRVYRVGAE
jgi:hypothetical protein